VRSLLANLVHPELSRITSAGDFRRGCELIGDLAVVAQAPTLEPGQVVLRAGGTLAVHLTDATHYGAALLSTTGSRVHLDTLCAMARNRGMTLTPQGLKRSRTIVATKTEEEIYAALDLP